MAGGAAAGGGAGVTREDRERLTARLPETVRLLVGGDLGGGLVRVILLDAAGEVLAEARMREDDAFDFAYEWRRDYA